MPVLSAAMEDAEAAGRELAQVDARAQPSGRANVKLELPDGLPMAQAPAAPEVQPAMGDDVGVPSDMVEVMETRQHAKAQTRAMEDGGEG